MWWPAAEFDTAADLIATPLFQVGSATIYTSTTPERDERKSAASLFASAMTGGALAGFGYARGSVVIPSIQVLMIPTWFAVAVLLAPLALLTARRLRRGWRATSGVLLVVRVRPAGNAWAVPGVRGRAGA